MVTQDREPICLRLFVQLARRADCVRCLHRGKKQRHQRTNDGHDDQQFDKRETAARGDAFPSVHAQSFSVSSSHGILPIGVSANGSDTNENEIPRRARRSRNNTGTLDAAFATVQYIFDLAEGRVNDTQRIQWTASKELRSRRMLRVANRPAPGKPTAVLRDLSLRGHSFPSSTRHRSQIQWGGPWLWRTSHACQEDHVSHRLSLSDAALRYATTLAKTQARSW